MWEVSGRCRGGLRRDGGVWAVLMRALPSTLQMVCWAGRRRERGGGWKVWLLREMGMGGCWERGEFGKYLTMIVLLHDERKFDFMVLRVGMTFVCILFETLFI